MTKVKARCNMWPRLNTMLDDNDLSFNLLKIFVQRRATLLGQQCWHVARCSLRFNEGLNIILRGAGGTMAMGVARETVEKARSPIRGLAPLALENPFLLFPVPLIITYVSAGVTSPDWSGASSSDSS